MKLSSFVGLLTLTVLLGMVATSCSKKKKDADSSDEAAVDGGTDAGKDSGSDTGTGTDDGLVATAGTLGLAVPTDVVLASPYNAETPAMALAANTEFQSTLQAGTVGVKTASLMDPPTNPPQGEQAHLTPGQARAQFAKLVYASTDVASCLYDSQPQNNPKPNCYGPQVIYSEHATRQFPVDSNDLNFGGGDLGIVQEKEGDQACIAAQMNYKINETAAVVDDVMGNTGMLLCLGRVAGKSLPEIGATIDLVDVNAPGITAATIARLDDKDGHPVYQTTFTVTSSTTVRQINILHSPQDDDNTLYKGKLWVKSSAATTPASGSCNPTLADNQATHALSIIYDKTAATAIGYEVRNSKWMPDVTDADMFDAKHLAKAPTVCNMGADFALYAIDPTNNTGKVSYSWIAGQAGENARSFVADVAVAGDAKTGCGYYTFGKTFTEILAERAAASAGDQMSSMMDHMICDWGHSTSPPGTPSTTILVQRQCMDQGTDGTFAPTSSEIRFAPTATCQDETGTAHYLHIPDLSGGPTAVVETIDAPTTHELLPIVASYGSGESATNAVLSDLLKSPAIPADIE